MELKQIETLLEAYFEGQTTLQEEQQLQAYFLTADVPTHLLAYKPMFVAFSKASEEVYTGDLPELSKPKSKRFSQFAAAASVVLLMAFGAMQFLKPNNYTQEEQAALAAFQQSKEALQMLSSNFNKGAQGITLVSTFNTHKNKVLK